MTLIKKVIVNMAVFLQNGQLLMEMFSLYFLNNFNIVQIKELPAATKYKNIIFIAFKLKIKSFCTYFGTYIGFRL